MDINSKDLNAPEVRQSYDMIMNWFNKKMKKCKLCNKYLSLYYIKFIFFSNDKIEDFDP